MKYTEYEIKEVLRKFPDVAEFVLQLMDNNEKYGDVIYGIHKDLESIDLPAGLANDPEIVIAVALRVKTIRSIRAVRSLSETVG